MRVGVAGKAQRAGDEGEVVVGGVSEIDAVVLTVLRAQDDFHAGGPPGAKSFNGLETVVGDDARVEEMDGADVHAAAAEGDLESRRADTQALWLLAQDGSQGRVVLAVEGDGNRAGGAIGNAAALDEETGDPQIDALKAGAVQGSGEEGLAVTLHDIQVGEVEEEAVDLGDVAGAACSGHGAGAGGLTVDVDLE